MSEKPVFTCRICSEAGTVKTYGSKGALTKHERQWHGLNPNGHVSVECPLCPFSGHKPELREHYEKDHGYFLEKIVKKFHSFADFEVWKKEVEFSSYAEYIKRRQPYTTSDGSEKILYSCSRDGVYKPRATGQREPKITGSKKINSYCPAEMKLTLSPGLVLVEFTGTHVGHELQAGQTSLSQSQRDDIARKIDNQVPFDVILNDAQQSASTNVSRENLLQRQDLYNIEKSKNLTATKSVRVATHGSLKKWVEDSNAQREFVRYFKEEGDIPKSEGLQVEDFLVIFFNDAQLEVLRRFGKDCVCVDHVLNTRDNYLLTSLLVADDLKQGLPTAFMLSNRVDFAIMKVFFQTIKTALGSVVETELFLSEMGALYCSSWAAVMPPAKTVSYSAWCVDKVWRENLTIIADEAKRSEVYKNLRATLDELDEDTFNVMFEGVCRWMMDDLATQEFGTYFIDNFGSTAVLWAECCRKGTGINFKLTLERAHNTLQHICLQGKNVKTLDKAAQEVMAFTREKILERLTRKETSSYKLRSLKDGHKKTKQLEGCQLIKDLEDWVVKSPSSNVVAKIVKFHTECDCFLKCVECNGCAHMFVCTCLASSINWNMCKHIHLLCENLSLPKFIIGNGYISVAKKESADSGKNSETVNIEVDVVDVKEDKFLEERKRITELMTSIENRLKNATSKEEFEVAEELLLQVVPTIDSRKAATESKVKIIALEGGRGTCYVKAPEPPAKKQKVEFRHNQQLNQQGRVLIRNNALATATQPTNVLSHQNENPTLQDHQLQNSGTNTRQDGAMELLLGQQLSNNEEFVYGEEIILHNL